MKWLVGSLFAVCVAMTGSASGMEGATGAVFIGQQPALPAVDWAFFGYGGQGQIVICFDGNDANARAGRCPSGFLSPKEAVKKRWPSARYLGFTLVPAGQRLGVVLYYSNGGE